MHEFHIFLSYTDWNLFFCSPMVDFVLVGAIELNTIIIMMIIIIIKLY